MATKTLDHYVAKLVRREMADRLITAQAIAEVLNVGLSTAQRKVRGAQAFSLDEVATLSREFGVGLYALASDMRDADEEKAEAA